MDYSQIHNKTHNPQAITIMRFIGNIYITDPSYIAKNEDWMDSFDPMDEKIDCPEYTDFLMKFTGIGDGIWEVYDCGSHSLSEIQSIINKGDYSQYNVIGGFCVDSASACVVYQQEADKYNPSFMATFKDKPHCRALIKNFDGEIEAYYDSDGELHFIGIGNRCFFTA